MSDLSSPESEMDHVKDRVLESMAFHCLNSVCQSTVTSIRRTQSALLVLFTLATITLTLFGYQVYRTSKEIEARSVSTVAVAKNVAVVHNIESFLAPYRVYYGFKVDGKLFMGTGYSFHKVVSGEKVAIRYFRENPRQSFVPGYDNLILEFLLLAGAINCSLAAFRSGVRLQQMSETSKGSLRSKLQQSSQRLSRTLKPSMGMPLTDVMPLATRPSRMPRRQKA